MRLQLLQIQRALIASQCQIHIQVIAPAHGDLIALSEIVGERGRYATYRIMVYEKDRAVAQCDGVAIRTDQQVPGRSL